LTEGISIGKWSTPTVNGVEVCDSEVNVDITGGGLLVDVARWVYYGFRTNHAEDIEKLKNSNPTRMVPSGVLNPCNMPTMELCPPLHPLVISPAKKRCPAFFKCSSRWALEEPSTYLRLGSDTAVVHYTLSDCYFNPLPVVLIFIPLVALVWCYIKWLRRQARIRSEKMNPEWEKIYKESVMAIDNMHSSKNKVVYAKQHGRLPPLEHARTNEHSSKYKPQKIHPGALKC
jgi:hypothetical protein